MGRKKQTSDRMISGKQGKCITLAIFASPKCLLRRPKTRLALLGTVGLLTKSVVDKVGFKIGAFL